MSEQGAPEQWRSGHGQDQPPGYHPGYGEAPGYGQPFGYGPAQPYGYGPPAQWPGVPRTWPHGPGRPGITTAAAVLGFVTAGLTALVSLGCLMALLTDDGDAVTGVLVLGLPCAAGLVYGGVQLLGRRSPAPLLASALAAVGVLVLALVVAAGTLDNGEDLAGLTFFVVLAGVLPVLTAVFARVPATTGWTGGGPPA